MFNRFLQILLIDSKVRQKIVFTLVFCFSMTFKRSVMKKLGILILITIVAIKVVSIFVDIKPAYSLSPTHNEAMVEVMGEIE